MSATDMLELKHRISSLPATKQRELRNYMMQLKYKTPEGKRELSRIMREMDAGKKFSLEDVAKKLGHV